MKLDKIKFARLLNFIGGRLGCEMSAECVAELDELIDVEVPEVSKRKLNKADELYVMLSEGRASAACQKDAANWIKELHEGDC